MAPRQPLDLTLPISPPQPQDLTQPMAPQQQAPAGRAAAFDLTQPEAYAAPAAARALDGSVVVAPAGAPAAAVAPGPFGSMPRAGSALPTAALAATLPRPDRRGIPWGERMEKSLAMGLPLLLLSVLLVHANPSSIIWLSLADMFLLSLALGATGAIPPYEDALLDVGIVLVLCFLAGPVLTLLVYGVVGLIKQECNGALIGLLAISIALRLVLGLAVFNSMTVHLSAFLMIGIMGMLGFIPFFVGVAGWILSGFFRPLDAR